MQRLQPKSVHALTEFTRKYGVTGALWVGEPFTQAHYAAELSEFFKNGADPARELA